MEKIVAFFFAIYSKHVCLPITSGPLSIFDILILAIWIYFYFEHWINNSDKIWKNTDFSNVSVMYVLLRKGLSM